jgi:hypothetical protein
MLQNISVTYAATWWQKLAAYSNLNLNVIIFFNNTDKLCIYGTLIFILLGCLVQESVL